jgi:signal transduction histidine kinase
MLFARARELTRSLAFRLTLWHQILLLLALALCYTTSYLLVSSLAIARIDTYLKDESDECVRFYALQQRTAVEKEANREARSQGFKDIFFAISNPAGDILFRTDQSAWTNLQIPASQIQQVASTGKPVVQSMNRGGKEAEVRVRHVSLSPSYVLTIATSMHDEMQLLHGSMNLVLAAMVGVWILAGIVQLFFARRAMRGIYTVRNAAIAFANGNTSQRVASTAHGDEIDLLANAFNVMAERIEGLLTNLRQTNDSLAHELRTPITGMRCRCELALTHKEADVETAGAATHILAETIERCDHMLSIINTTLEISETDAGMAHLVRQPVDLGKLLDNACDIFEPLAEDSRIILVLEKKTHALVSGDKGKLQRLFSNLVDNALKYSTVGGKITVRLESRGSDVLVSVRDSGPGIPENEMETIFERFYRGSAGANHPGNGLGLSLARTIVRAHGGTITARNAHGGGAEFLVQLPAIPDPPQPA